MTLNQKTSSKFYPRKPMYRPFQMTKIETQNILIDSLGLDLKQHGFINEHLAYADIRRIVLTEQITGVLFVYRMVFAAVTFLFAIAWILALIDCRQSASTVECWHIILPPISLSIIVIALVVSAFKKRWILNIHMVSGHHIRINITDIHSKGQLHQLYRLLENRTILEGWKLA